MVAKNLTPRTMTVEEFLEWCREPEQYERRFELVRGVPEEMPSPGFLHGTLCAWIAHLLWNYILLHGKGLVVSNDTGMIIRNVPDTVRGPDVLVLDGQWRREEIHSGLLTHVPALIVEVYSPSDRPGRLSRRIADYHAHGVPLVWVVYPEDQVVDIHRVGHSVEAKVVGDTLTGADVLPDLSLSVAEVFHLPGTQASASVTP
jgi:Uma2 family endonuclease